MKIITDHKRESPSMEAHLSNEYAQMQPQYIDPNTSFFRLILKSHELYQEHRNSIFLFMRIPHLMTSQGDLLINPH